MSAVAPRSRFVIRQARSWRKRRVFRSFLKTEQDASALTAFGSSFHRGGTNRGSRLDRDCLGYARQPSLEEQRVGEGAWTHVRQRDESRVDPEVALWTSVLNLNQAAMGGKWNRFILLSFLTVAETLLCFCPTGPQKLTMWIPTKCWWSQSAQRIRSLNADETFITLHHQLLLEK